MSTINMLHSMEDHRRTQKNKKHIAGSPSQNYPFFCFDHWITGCIVEQDRATQSHLDKYVCIFSRVGFFRRDTCFQTSLIEATSFDNG